MKCFKNAVTYVERSGLVRCTVEFDETITFIGDSSSAEEMVLPSGCIVLPGFVDQHVHGAGGADAMDGTVEAIEIISKTLAKEGTTSFLATTMTQSEENIEKAMHAVNAFRE